MARFYFRLERNLGRRYRDYGMRLLSSITPTQRWGIPAAAGMTKWSFAQKLTRPRATEQPEKSSFSAGLSTLKSVVRT